MKITLLPQTFTKDSGALSSIAYTPTNDLANMLYQFSTESIPAAMPTSTIKTCFVGLIGAAVCILICLLFFVYIVMDDYRRHSIMPPGPIPIPFVGNKWDLPSCKPWCKFQEWTERYGSMITVWTGRRATIVIGDPQVACDLLDKRSAIYSSRPRFVIMGEMFTNNDALLTMPHGPKWRKTRKVFHTGLHRKACDSYKPIQESESARLARDLLETPQDFAKHLERFAASLMVCVAYGRRVDNLEDNIVKRIYERMQYMATLNVPGAFWAESFPLLKLVPDFLAPWKRELKKRAKASTELLFDLTRTVRDDIDRGIAPPSFTKSLYEKYDQGTGELTEREIAYATGSLFGAGSDTTSSTLTSFVLAMTCFPHVAARAQEELDAVVGRDRAPTWEDEPNLPYCRAVIKETLRWRPVAVMGGTPHASIKDDFYNDHFIPKGTTILGNLWAIHHNEKYFDNTHDFMPERYLDDPSLRPNLVPYPHRDGHSAFGWGRRICPGKALAENSLFLSITRILWGFDITKARDMTTGEEITPNTFAYTDGFNSKPHPFQCCITPRTPQLEATIRKDAKLGEAFLQRYPSTGQHVKATQ